MILLCMVSNYISAFACAHDDFTCPAAWFQAICTYVDVGGYYSF
jgi:hypothetical protein